MKVNPGQLRTFVTVFESGGVHRAVARLHLSQPAASRQIKALEAALGVPLFDRIGRRLKLTAEGEELLRLSRRLLGEVETFNERAAALKKGETGILRVAATPQVIENTLSNFLDHYRRRYPGIEVQLVEEGGIAMPRHLERGDVHLALMALDDDRFRIRLLYPVRGIAVVPDQLGSAAAARSRSQNSPTNRFCFSATNLLRVIGSRPHAGWRVFGHARSLRAALRTRPLPWRVRAMVSRWYRPPSSFRPVTSVVFHFCNAAQLSAAGCGSHGNLSGSCPFMPSNSSMNSQGIASETTPVENLTGTLRRCLDQGGQCGD